MTTYGGLLVANAIRHRELITRNVVASRAPRWSLLHCMTLLMAQCGSSEISATLSAFSGKAHTSVRGLIPLDARKLISKHNHSRKGESQYSWTELWNGAAPRQKCKPKQA